MHPAALKTFFLSMALTGCGIFALPGAALAKDHDKGHGYGKHGQAQSRGDDNQEERRGQNGDTILIRIDTGDRAIIRNYIGDNYRRHCPPGLAKKHNGCLPPGQEKKRYRVGASLPDDVVFVPVGPGLFNQLSTVPPGYQYVQVDKDVLLISEAGKKVIDAVTLLSAVGQ